MVEKNYYDILMIDERASEKEIRKAYYRCVHLYHPDVAGGGDASKFIEVVKAYKILSDPARRMDYDRLLKSKNEKVLRRSQENLKRNASRMDGFGSWFRDGGNNGSGRPSGMGPRGPDAPPRSEGNFATRRADGGTGSTGVQEEILKLPTDELIDRLKFSNNEHVRKEAINALMAQGASCGVNAIRDSLKDPKVSVRLAAIGALGKLKARRAVDSLLDILAKNDREVLRDALVALGEIGSRRAADHILPFLRDGDPEVRREAISALGKLGGRSAISHLRRAARDRDPTIRKSAREAISRIKAYMRSATP
ncbi:MAG: HEAT repeat domain-containing protein [bacterium]